MEGLHKNASNPKVSNFPTKGLINLSFCFCETNPALADNSKAENTHISFADGIITISFNVIARDKTDINDIVLISPYAILTDRFLINPVAEPGPHDVDYMKFLDIIRNDRVFTATAKHATSQLPVQPGSLIFEVESGWDLEIGESFHSYTIKDPPTFSTVMLKIVKGRMETKPWVLDLRLNEASISYDRGCEERTSPITEIF